MENNKIKDKIDELVESLNRASKAYYNGADEIMPNYEWDAMFDELTQLEKETGYIRHDSPTQNAGYEAEAGNRAPHEYPALSLAKTKSIEELKKWAGEDVYKRQLMRRGFKSSQILSAMRSQLP